MEKWKIAVIAALLVGLVGFGIYQNAQDNAPPVTSTIPTPTPGPSPYEGKMLPAWSFKTWSTKPVPLPSLYGKPSLVEIFRIQCPHCQDAAPYMVGLQKRYGPRGLKIVAIESPGDLKDPSNPEGNWKDVQTWMKGYGTNYPVALDVSSRYYQGTILKQILKGDESKLLYPTTLLLDSKGKVIKSHSGFQPSNPENLSKIIDMAVQIEKNFPGSKSTQANAKDLVAWLQKFLPDLTVDGPLKKALEDDIAHRLKEK